MLICVTSETVLKYVNYSIERNISFLSIIPNVFDIIIDELIEYNSTNIKSGIGNIKLTS